MKYYTLKFKMLQMPPISKRLLNRFFSPTA